MPFKKKSPAELRTFILTIRFKPEVKEQILATIERWAAKKEQIRKMKLDAGEKLPPEEEEAEYGIAEFVRRAVWEYCKLPDDPRKP